MAKALSAAEVARIKKPGKHSVGDGAYLQVAAGGTRSWLFRYERDGKGHWMGLGPCALLTLAEARAKARDARRQLLDGADPLATKREKRARARLEAATAITFKQAAERMMASHEAAWKNPKHRAQWKATLSTYAYEVFGDLPVASVDTGLVLKALEPIWTTKPETASRVRGRIESVLDWAKARGYREGENPATWRGHLDKLLPNRRKVRRVEHHAALLYSDLPAFMAELRERDSISARALEFAILTAARTGEVIGAKWSEIVGDVWSVPAGRMKAGTEHRVPLAPRAVEILEKLPREREFVFMGGRAGRPLSNMAMLELLRGMRPGLTVHGFRSAFRDWAAERTAYPNHVVEMALAHKVANAVEAAYRRGDLFEKRKALMSAWETYCTTLPAVGDNVVPIREGVP